jgi:hypothetical protein
MRKTVETILAWAMCLGVTFGCCGQTGVSFAAVRSEDPVVLLGSVLPWSNVAPGDVVAFVYNDGWSQIPVQIDERDVREFSTIYGASAEGNPFTADFGTGVFETVYCDSETFTGSDTDPTVDADDEIVFMACDIGGRAPEGSNPAHVEATSGLELRLVDPLTAASGYVYLFVQDGTLDPAAGVSYVAYDFSLDAGDYRSSYNTGGIDAETGERNDDFGKPLNPEDSWIRTSVYERHWSYRWTCDHLSLYGGVNLVEREDYWIAPGACVRHIGTFNAQEGCFIANVSGPVRAIRSFLGANSGPSVQVDRIYYRAREDVAIYLRVHPRSAVGTFYIDYTPAAIGMTYANDLNPGGVPVDGLPDDLILGAVTWELMTGEAGSLVHVHDLDTDIAFADDEITLFYADEMDTETRLCSACLEGCEQLIPIGDAHLIAASGIWITGALPNTDPALLGTQYLTMTSVNYLGPSGWGREEAERLAQCVAHPIEVAVETRED